MLLEREDDINTNSRRGWRMQTVSRGDVKGFENPCATEISVLAFTLCRVIRETSRIRIILLARTPKALASVKRGVELDGRSCWWKPTPAEIPTRFIGNSTRFLRSRTASVPRIIHRDGFILGRDEIRTEERGHISRNLRILWYQWI